jgi:hypothetical protein
MLPSTANRFVLAVCGLLVRVSDIATLLGKDAVIAAIAKKATAAITKPETYEQKPPGFCSIVAALPASKRELAAHLI